MRPSLLRRTNCAEQHAAEQQPGVDEIQDVLGVVGADVPAVERPQVGDAVDAAGVALLADDQDRQDGGDRLGDDGEIDAADAPLEHRDADDQRQQRRHQRHRDQREGQAVERLPEPRQRGDLVPVHEVRDARRGLDLGASGVEASSLRNIAMQ